MNNLITVCIPTCNRPDLLKEAVQSCCEQTYRPLEILVGDDSEDDRAASALSSIKSDADFTFAYHKNESRLGQAANVNSLFTRAQGDRVVLLHDDDLLTSQAVDILAECWSAYPTLTAVFGKQYIISVSGEIDQQETDNVNQLYGRTKERAGLQRSSLESALMQQFPNDGFMIHADVARRIRLRGRDEVGNASDFDFGIRVAQEGASFYFVNEFTCKYRHTPGSISTSSWGGFEYMFPIVENLRVPPEVEAARELALKRMVPVYVKYLGFQRKRVRALRTLFGPYGDSRMLLSMKGWILLGQILAPGIDPALQKIRKALSQR